jgi:riboflavin kinase/FMN adenylyltransferase
MNLGYRPTLDHPQPQLSVEVHVLNWSGDLYGRSLTVDLEEFIRPEQKFTSIETLKEQIRKDCEAVQNWSKTLV